VAVASAGQYYNLHLDPPLSVCVYVHVRVKYNMLLCSVDVTVIKWLLAGPSFSCPAFSCPGILVLHFRPCVRRL